MAFNIDTLNDGDSHKRWDVLPWPGESREDFFKHVLDLGRNDGDTDAVAASRILSWPSAQNGMPPKLRKDLEAVAKSVTKAMPEGQDMYVPGAGMSGGKKHCRKCGSKKHWTKDHDAAMEGLEKAITPGGRVGDASPLGNKPGGPRQLVDYIREIAHALMRKGMSKSHAIAVARNQLAKWASGQGNVSPKVRAAAAKALAEQQALDKKRRVTKSEPITFEEHMALRAQMREEGYLPPMTEVEKKFYSAAARRNLAKPNVKGHVMPGGRYPIKDKQDWKNAYMDYIRTGRKPEVKAYLLSVARREGWNDLLDGRF